MAGKGGDHPFATGLIYVVAAVIAVFLIGRLTHTDLLSFARNGSDALSRALGGGSPASSSDLADLKVAKAGSASGYDRSKFPDDDANANGCATRDDVLARDLSGVGKRGPCRVTSGTLHDPYTGRTVSGPGGVRVDHVVPLRTAWRSGAADWDQAKRTRFANDPDTLLAVGAGAARDRDERGPGSWGPGRRYQCAFAQRYVTVARDYDLTVTKKEHDALTRMLGRC